MDWHVKDTELHFVDWFCATFGCEPGRDQERIIGALHRFLAVVPKDSPFDLAVLDASPVTAATAFLMTESLARMGAVRYGGSRRQAVLTPNGRRIAEFLEQHSQADILDMFEKAAPRTRCLPDLCNCALGDCRTDNAFWEPRYGKYPELESFHPAKGDARRSGARAVAINPQARG